MRSFVVFIALTSIILQNCSNLFILLDYQVNKNYIAKVLCINKEKPQLKCHGKCQLSTRLEKEQEQKEQKENTLKFSFNVLYCASAAVIAYDQFTNTMSFEDGYKVSDYTTPVFSIFHPPLG